jgi:DNA-binding transcriptional LysR family regulator
MDLNQIDLNLLVALDALLAERSVTRAAQRLSIGQSAMSSTLGRLRTMLNDPVLVREGRVLVATPLAESLQVPVRDALARIESILSTEQVFDPAVDSRAFTVMGSDYVATTFLHPLLVRLGEQAPNVRLNVRSMDDEFEDRLRRGEVDVVIVPREVFPRYTDFCHLELFTDEWVCAVDADHPGVGTTITIEQFSALPYLAISSGSRPSSATMQLDILGVPHRTEFTVGLGAAPFLLRGTKLVTLIPARLARRFVDLANLRILDPPMAMPPLTETLVWTKRSDDDPGHRWLRQSFAELAPTTY